MLHLIDYISYNTLTSEQDQMADISNQAISHAVAQWCNGKAFGLAIRRSRVQILLEAMLSNNLRQVVYTYVPLSPSSITWYRPKGGDALVR